MKKTKRISVIFLTSLIGFLLVTCQKEFPLNENKMIFNNGTKGSESIELISSPVSSYLVRLTGLINTMSLEGLLTRGNANSLNAKIDNAIKSYSKSNLNAFRGQLNAFLNETKAYMEEGILTPDQGELLVNKIETVMIAVEGSFTDPLDGYVYPVVLLGDQLWMAENLRALKYSDGTEIPLVTLPADWSALTTGAYCWFGNRYDLFGSKYGAMYNWYAVNTGNLCPAGWHVPSLDEWRTLKIYLVEEGYGYEGNAEDIAKAMASTSGWALSKIAGTPGNDQSSNNGSGFNALPGGQRANNGNFYIPLNVGNWWAGSEMIPGVASFGINITFASPTMRIAGYSNKMGLYVRCMR